MQKAEQDVYESILTLLLPLVLFKKIEFKYRVSCVYFQFYFLNIIFN